MAQEIKNTEIQVGLIGSSNVGKTCIVIRMVDDKFEENVAYTPQLAYHKLKDQNLNGHMYDITFIDTAGTERFRSFNWVGLKNAQLFLYVYDVTNPDSHADIATLLQDADNQSIDPSIPKFLIGNKFDEGVCNELKDNNAYEGRFVKSFLFSAKEGSDREKIIQEILQYATQSQNTPQTQLTAKKSGCC